METARYVCSTVLLYHGPKLIVQQGLRSTSVVMCPNGVELITRRSCPFSGLIRTAD